MEMRNFGGVRIRNSGQDADKIVQLTYTNFPLAE